MKIIIKTSLVIFLAIQFSCGSGHRSSEKENKSAIAPAADTGKTEEKPFANIHFASKYDTSCGMPLAAGLEDTVQLNGKIYGFCSIECKDEFINKLKGEKKR